MPVQHHIADLWKAAQNIVRLVCVNEKNAYIYKKSIDARRRQEIHYVYTVALRVSEGEGRKILASGRKDVRKLEETGTFEIHAVRKLPARPVVVGTGPCGLFAAYLLAQKGYTPLVLERGDSIDRRAEKVREFWNGGPLDSETNVQFGEGGAGTFSDGKLNTRIGDPLQRYILTVFADCGAPGDILYQAKPHIGTDKLRSVVKEMRRRIIEWGGEVRFCTKLTDIRIKGGRLTEIELNGAEWLPCGCLVLAIGHSSRDTYEMLYRRGVAMEAKAFAAGARVEHLQEEISRHQYGKFSSLLPAADYRLVYNGRERSCYSFCMCPGGVVVNASSEQGGLVVNGMSEHARDGRNANSALVVTVRPEDFGEASPLAGIAFQRKYEKLAYRLGWGKAPVQRTADFLLGRVSDRFSEVRPSFTGQTVFAPLDECLPEFIVRTLKEGLAEFERKIPGFSAHGLLTGVEMRTSAPLRVLRGSGGQSVNCKGLYPAGEGAGYAGGIMSAAIDGVRLVAKLMEAEPKGE